MELTHNGVISALVSNLSDVTVRIYAIQALANMTEEGDIARRDVRETGGIRPLALAMRDEELAFRRECTR